jgi:hypothetical protein
MTTAIKKLIGSIDQLVVWLNENPNTPMPSQEKKRVMTILNMIMKTKEISDEEWEKLKPERSAPTVIHEIRYRPAKKDTMYDDIFNYSPRKTAINHIPLPFKKTIPKALKNTTSKKPAAAIKPISNKREMVKYPDCGSPVLRKNIEKHKGKCTHGIQKMATIQPPAILRNIQTVHIPTILPMMPSEEKRLDGSYGYHQFRENGKFGSYPSFDNMNDESRP